MTRIFLLLLLKAQLQKGNSRELSMRGGRAHHWKRASRHATCGTLAPRRMRVGLSKPRLSSPEQDLPLCFSVDVSLENRRAAAFRRKSLLGGLGAGNKVSPPNVDNPWTHGLCCPVLSLRHAWLLATPWTVAHQAPLSMGSPGRNTGVGCHALLQGGFPTQGPNPGFQHYRQILSCLSHQRSPKILGWVACPFPRGSPQPRNRTKVSCIAGGFFNSWATREVLIHRIPYWKWI